MTNKKLIYADFKFFLLALLSLGLIYATTMRGLYFEPDLLPFHMFSFALLIIMIFDILLKKEGNFAPIAMDYAVIGLMVGYIISYFNAVYLRGALRETLVYVNFFIIYLVTWQTIQKEKDITRFINLMYFCTILVAFIGLGSALALVDFPGAFGSNRIHSTFQYANAFGIFTVVGLFLAKGYWITTDTVVKKGFHASIIYLLSLALLASQSRGSWLVYIILISGLIFVLRKNVADIIFMLFFYTGTALIASRWFIPSIIKKDEPKAVIILAIGLALVITFEILHKVVISFITKVPERIRKFMLVGGTVYVVIIAGIYLAYIDAAVPSVAARFVSPEVSSRVASIGASNSSEGLRKTFIIDGLKIGMEHLPWGAGGQAWNALYHSEQSYMYWTSEPHSQPIKIWLEAGIIGVVCYLAIWILASLKVVSSLTKLKDTTLQKRLLFLLTGLLALFIHSIIDFDLSFPGLLFFIAMGFGVIRGTYSLINQRRKTVDYKYLLPAVVVLAIIFVPFYRIAADLKDAGIYGALGARALKNNNIQQAIFNYDKAHILDPNNHYYILDLAQIYTALNLRNNDIESLNKGKYYAKLALTLNPYDLKIQGRLINLFLQQEDYPSAVGTAENFVKISPLNMNAYEYLAQAYFSSLQNALINNDTITKEKLIKKLDKLDQEIKKHSERPRVAGEYWKGEKIRPTALTEINIAKTQVIKGDYISAINVLKKYTYHKKYGHEAKIWLSVIHIKLNNKVKSEISPEDRNIMNSIIKYLH